MEAIENQEIKKICTSFDYEAIKTQVYTNLEQGISLTQMCKAKDFPSKSTIMDWLDADKSFADHYARSRDIGLEKRSDEIFDIADTCGLTSEEINKARLQIDARKWVLSKLLPKKYGDKQALDVTGKLTLGELVEQAFKLKADKVQEPKQ